MNSPFRFSLMPTGIGSMPHIDPPEAAEVVRRTTPELPAWPQLVRRSPMEGMIAQFAAGIAGFRVKGDVLLPEGDQGSYDSPCLTEESAPGFFAMLEKDLPDAKGMKGQVTGPLTFSSLMIQKDGRSALAELPVARQFAQYLGRLGEWQETQLRRVNRHTLMFLDEPMLSKVLASSEVGPVVARDLIVTTLAPLRGWTGLHCCAEPDWDFLVNLPVHVISFDAYRYSVTTEMAAAPIRDFLAQGGAIAWGIVPAGHDALANETVESLMDLLMRTWGRLTDLGVPQKLLERQSLITPACGLANLTPQEAELALGMASSIAALLRQPAVAASRRAS